MDRTALAAALSAGLLAPAGWAEDQDPAPRGVICGDPESKGVASSPSLDVESGKRAAA